MLRSLHEHYPDTDDAPQALMLAGEVLLLNLQKDQEALLSFLLVDRDYPDTSWGQAARQRIAEIYKYRLQGLWQGTGSLPKNSGQQVS